MGTPNPWSLIHQAQRETARWGITRHIRRIELPDAVQDAQQGEGKQVREEKRRESPVFCFVLWRIFSSCEAFSYGGQSPLADSKTAFRGQFLLSSCALRQTGGTLSQAEKSGHVLLISARAIMASEKKKEERQ